MKISRLAIFGAVALTMMTAAPALAEMKAFTFSMDGNGGWGYGEGPTAAAAKAEASAKCLSANPSASCRTPLAQSMSGAFVLVRCDSESQFTHAMGASRLGVAQAEANAYDAIRNAGLDTDNCRVVVTK